MMLDNEQAFFAVRTHAELEQWFHVAALLRSRNPTLHSQPHLKAPPIVGNGKWYALLSALVTQLLQAAATSRRK